MVNLSIIKWLTSTDWEQFSHSNVEQKHCNQTLFFYGIANFKKILYLRRQIAGLNNLFLQGTRRNPVTANVTLSWLSVQIQQKSVVATGFDHFVAYEMNQKSQSSSQQKDALITKKQNNGRKKTTTKPNPKQTGTKQTQTKKTTPPAAQLPIWLSS